QRSQQPNWNRKETKDTLTPMDQHFSTSRGANQRVLFICTGNFYRSRFAEAIFNHYAEQRQIPWTAFSRGLAVHLAEGDLSSFTSEALKTRKIRTSAHRPLADAAFQNGSREVEPARRARSVRAFQYDGKAISRLGRPYRLLGSL